MSVVELQSAAPADRALVAEALTVSVNVSPPGKCNRPACLGRPTMRRTILDHVDVAFPYGSLTAMLGPSGAGKTTLLNAMCGRANGHVSGEVLCDPSRSGFTFIVQDDIMPQTLTPREILYYTAELMLPSSYSCAQKNARIEELLDTFYLQQCADTIVGIPGEKRGISGGERKRVSIAMSIVANPQLIFVDEPTSGLDSSAALNVVKILSRLAQEGRTIVCCIHQPSQDIFELFSHVCLLAKGRMMYFGPFSQLKTYFGSLGCYQPRNTTVAEWLIDMVDTNRENLPIESPKAAQQITVVVVDNEAKPHAEASPVAGAHPAISEPLQETAEAAAAAQAAQPKRRKKKKHSRNDDSPPVDPVLEAARPPAHSNEFLDYLASGYLKSELCAEIKKSVDCHDGLVRRSTIKAHYARSFPTQIAILFRRNMLGQLRDRGYVLSRVMQSVVVAALLAIIFANQGHTQVGLRNRLGIVFCAHPLSGMIAPHQLLNHLVCCMIQLLFAMLSVLFVLPQDFAVFLREFLNGTYRAAAYIPARILADTPMLIFIPLLFSCILYWSAGLNPDSTHVLLFMAVMILVANVGGSVGFLVSSLARGIARSLQIAPAIYLPNIMFAGFVVSIPTITPVLRWLEWISFLKYAFAILVNNEFTGSQALPNTYHCDPGEYRPVPLRNGTIVQTCPFTNGEQFLEYQGFADVNITAYCLALVGFILLFRFLSTVVVVHRMNGYIRK